MLLTTADHALLTPAVVDHFCEAARATGADVVVGLARAEQVLAAFPGTRRTILRLKGGGYCGCNLFAFLTPTGRGAAQYWRRVEQQRKRPLRLAAGVLGWSAILDYALGRLTLERALERMSRRLGLRAGAVILPFPEAAVDVDSVEDLQLVRVSSSRAAEPSRLHDARPACDVGGRVDLRPLEPLDALRPHVAVVGHLVDHGQVPGVHRVGAGAARARSPPGRARAPCRGTP